MNEQIRGRVVDRHGRGVAEATVIVLQAPESVPDIAALTDADGRFAFDVASPGTYRLRAIGPDGGAGEGDFTVPKPGVSEGVIRLRDRAEGQGFETWKTSLP